MHLVLLSSVCARTDAYIKIIEKIISDNSIHATIELFTDTQTIANYGVTNGCRTIYCPGCNHVNRDDKELFYTPALFINDELVLHSCMPKKNQLTDILESYSNDKDVDLSLTQ